MNSEQRREKIISVLQMSDKPVSAACFANEFSVTRQIIVADIALLRAKGHQIRAEHKGYVLEKSDSCDMHKSTRLPWASLPAVYVEGTGRT